MAAANCDAHVVAALDEVAWLANLRGGDVPFNPVFIAYALVEAHRATLFLHLDAVSSQVRQALSPDFVLRPYEELDFVLHEICLKKIRVWIDQATVNQGIVDSLHKFGAEIVARPGAIPMAKGAKNTMEIQGMRSAHVRDGLAMVRFLAWLNGAVDKGFETELSVARKVKEVRAEHPLFVGMSFSSIVAYKGHGAIVHYSPSEESDAALSTEGILLVDSGAQYADGTTDITRTVALGKPTPFQKRAYTVVLKGHLALARTMFPVGTNGYQLDIVARSKLWEHGLNYGHGTGHGVGAALSVHEGPFSVSLRRNLTPLVPGNILSNEPGFYKAGEFGIRIENLMLVVERGATEGTTFLGMEPLTLCPYCRDLIDVEVLTPEEIRQVDSYHRMVMERLGPELPRDVRNWLSVATAPLQ
jgi:Xaa-Pro aminopeptidase